MIRVVGVGGGGWVECAEGEADCDVRHDWSPDLRSQAGSGSGEGGI